jgi:mRNA interferase YafO
MATRYTTALDNQLAEIFASAAQLAADFDAWKSAVARNPAAEFENPHFGKDGAYVAPKVDGVPYALRHVHLVPLKDAEALTKWERFFRLKKRKISNRVLVYVSSTSGNHLLLFILDEPSAHEVAEMKTPEHQKLMLQMADVAAAFLHDGSITA